MATIHISEAEAARDFYGVLARVREGAEVVIDSATDPVIVRSAVPARRTISECIAVAEQHERETGVAAVPDPEFARDVEEIVRNRKPWNPPAWD